MPETASPTPSPPELRNIQAIIALERGTKESRSAIDRLTDAVSMSASSPSFIVAHLVWFATWIGLNLHRSAFDPFPFNLLTLAVSLEAIVLTGFVLMAQNRMTQQADKRAHLDLQINLLAEQELTAILKVVCQLADNNGIDVVAGDPGFSSCLGRRTSAACRPPSTRNWPRWPSLPTPHAVRNTSSPIGSRHDRARSRAVVRGSGGHEGMNRRPPLNQGAAHEPRRTRRQGRSAEGQDQAGDRRSRPTIPTSTMKAWSTKRPDKPRMRSDALGARSAKRSKTSAARSRSEQ